MEHDVNIPDDAVTLVNETTDPDKTSNENLELAKDDLHAITAHEVRENGGLNGEYEREYINATGTYVSEMTDDDNEQNVYRDGFYKLVNIDSSEDKENATLQATNVAVNTTDYKALYEECKRQSTQLITKRYTRNANASQHN